MNKFTFLSILLIIGLTSCNCHKKQAQKTNEDNKTEQNCSTFVTVMDYRGLSSCAYLLRLEDGQELSVQSGVTLRELEGTATARISYEPIKEPYPTSCMRGQQVKITCFTVDKKGTPSKGNF